MNQAIQTLRGKLQLKQRLKKWLPVLIVVGIVVVIVGGFFGAKWYKNYVITQKEKKYQSVLKLAKENNAAGKYKGTEQVVDDYLKSNPQASYQTMPKYFAAVAYMNDKNYAKAKAYYTDIKNDPNLEKGTEKAILSSLIIIASIDNDKAASKKYLEEMVALLDKNSKDPQNDKYKMYYYVEKNRYEQILKSLESQM